MGKGLEGSQKPPGQRARSHLELCPPQINYNIILSFLFRFPVENLSLRQIVSLFDDIPPREND